MGVVMIFHKITVFNSILFLLLFQICLFSQDEKWVYFNETNSGLPDNWVNSLSINESGVILIGTNNGLVEYYASNWSIYNSDNSGLPFNTVLKTLIDDYNNYWLNTDGNLWGNAGLTTFNGLEWTTYNTTNSEMPFNKFNTLDVDQTGKIWIGSNLWGVASFYNGEWSHFTTSNSLLPDNHISAIGVDIENNIWISHNLGLSQISNSGDWVTYNENNSELPDNSIDDIFITSNNEIWIASSDHISNFNNDVWLIYDLSELGISYFPTVGCQTDLTGNFWVISNGEGILKFDGNTWEKFNKSNSPLPTNQFTDIIVDGNNNKWFGTVGSGLALYNENGVVLDSSDQGWQWPVKAPRITQDFATYGSVIPDYFHNGIDMTSSISDPSSTTVFAAQKGTVLILNNTCGEGDHCGNGFGNYVVLEHSKNLYSLYAHLKEVNVTVGQYINQGQRIGIMGATGRPDYSNHLHFEVLKYPPAGSTDFEGGYSVSFPDSSRRQDPKNYYSYAIVKVLTEKLNVRQEPKLTSVVFDSISMGQFFVAIAQYENWYFIYLPFNTVPDTSRSYLDVNRYGWVSGQYLEVVDRSLYPTIKIDGNTLWHYGKTWATVFAEPSVSSLELTKVWPGQRYVVLEYNQEWCKINLPSNASEQYGWINLNNITSFGEATAPLTFSLSQNYPNPFNPSTKINYSLPNSGLIKIRVYNLLGQEVETLVNDYKEMGAHSVLFDASNLSSGVYFYTIEADKYHETKKMLLLK